MGYTAFVTTDIMVIKHYYQQCCLQCLFSFMVGLCGKTKRLSFMRKMIMHDLADTVINNAVCNVCSALWLVCVVKLSGFLLWEKWSCMLWLTFRKVSIYVRRSKYLSTSSLPSSCHHLHHHFSSSVLYNTLSHLCIVIYVAGPLCGKFTGHRLIPLTKAGDADLWCFL